MNAPASGVRATRQRAAILALLDRTDRFRSAQSIFDELRADGHGIGLTTVYRTLQALVAGEVVDVLRSPAGESLYRRCETEEQHHHLVCRRCGIAAEIPGPVVEAWAREAAAHHGFSELSRTLEVFGLCRLCGTR
ncbi:Fur family transcriptional regulator [Pseudonocardia sp. RS010]|uniref:Fur family transcriptional regulator n=1 Tax=Pseudonocardia sp. RS010 TaxID=3385979 RepID=UPI0039A3E97D